MNKTENIKILQVPSGGLYIDGVFSCIKAYFEAMNQDGMEIDILSFNTPSEKIKKSIRELGCGIVTMPNRKKKPVAYFRSILSCMRQYDIVEIHGSSSIMAIEMLAAKLCGCKVRIAHSHNTTCDHKLLHNLLLPLFRVLYTDAFACGHMAGKWLFGNNAYIVIPNGRSIPQFSYSDQAREKTRKQCGFENDVVIGHVGGFNFQKNHSFLIDVFYDILKVKPNAKLVLMGTGGLMQEIREKVITLKIEDRVVFAGHIDNMAEMLSAMDVMMLPSWHEGLPLVALEWQISGLPCLISDRVTEECKVTDLVQFLPIDQGTTPWVTAFGETCCLAERAERAKAACADVKSAHFDIEENAQLVRELYFEAVNRVRKN